MNPGFSAEIAVLGLSIGLLLSLVCYLVSNLSPGGMITPGWLALVVVEDARRLLLLALVVVGTVVVMLGVRRVVILYGKRLFATVVMVAVFLQMTAFFILIDLFPSTLETTTLGFIVPGLIAYQLIRQPVVATLGAIASVTALSYGVMLAGVVFDLIPGLVAPTFSTGNIELTPLRVGFILIATLFGFIGVGIQMRRVRRPSMAPIAGRSSGTADIAPAEEAERGEAADDHDLQTGAPDAEQAPAPVAVASSEPPSTEAPGSDAAAGSSRRRLAPILALAVAGLMLFGAGLAVGRGTGGSTEEKGSEAEVRLIDTGGTEPTSPPGTDAPAQSKDPMRVVATYPRRCLRPVDDGRDGIAIATRTGVSILDVARGTTTTTKLEGEPRWSASGRWIGLTSGSVVDREGKRRQQLFGGPKSSWTWSPLADCGLAIRDGSIVVSHPGGRARVLVRADADGILFHPSGTSVAVLSRSGRDGLVSILDLDRGRMVRVGRVPSGSKLAAWGPTARSLATARRGRLSLLERGAAPVSLTRRPGAQVTPCGDRVLVAQRQRELVSQLTRGGLDTLARGYRGATCSPDGRFIATRSSNGDVAILDARGSLRTTLDVRAPGGSLLTWGPRGLMIATRRDGTLMLDMVTEGSGTARRVGTYRVRAGATTEAILDRVGVDEADTS